MFASPDDFSFTTWKVIDMYFKNTNNQLVKHIIDSYDDFILRKIDEVIDGFNPVEVNHVYIPEIDKFKYNLRLVLSNPTLSKPTLVEKDGSHKLMTPADARNRNFSYSASLFVDVDIITTMLTPVPLEGGESVEYSSQVNQKTIKGVSLGKIPIMVGSKYSTASSDECLYDVGAYLIISGSEKAIISQDRIAENKTYVFVSNKQSAYSHVAEVRSVQETCYSVPKTTSLKLSSKSNQYGKYIRATIHHIRHDIPVFVLFRALGVESDQDIINYITNDEYIIKNLIGSIEEGSVVSTQVEAFDYLLRYLSVSGYPKEYMNNKARRYEMFHDVLKNEFLPHTGIDYKKKAVYLGFMVNKLLRCFLGIQAFDDRDSYVNKRIDTPGILLANLFRQYYGKMIKDSKNMLNKEINSGSWKNSGNFSNILNKVVITKVIKSSIIETGLKFSCSTGVWGAKTSKTKQGVAQVLNRLSYCSMLSHLRRVNTAIEKSGKLVPPRKLHGTQFGVICPCETPEGASVGLVKNMSLVVNITGSSNPSLVHSIIADNDLIPFDPKNVLMIHELTKVIVNGNLVGVHRDPLSLYTVLKNAKLTGLINPFTMVYWNIMQQEICVCTQAGRCSRPMYTVSNNQINMSPSLVKAIDNVDKAVDIQLLTRNKCIEFMDVEESSFAMIAMRYGELNSKRVSFTHLELDPSLMLGVVASGIPFSNHNQSPRNCYQASMGKQAISLYATNFQKRLDTMAHVLNYPQVPLIQSRASKIVHFDKMPRGMNAIVAIMTYTGFNQEDSVIMNKSSVDRGLFSSTYYRTTKDHATKNFSSGNEEFYTRPDVPKGKGAPPYNYDKLEEDGFVKENGFIEDGDILFGKCMPQKVNGVIVNKDVSVCAKVGEHGYVDKVCANDRYFTNTNGDGFTFCKVRTRVYREPVIGDKFASCFAQKGVLGMLYDQVDMPFTQEGMVPDIIMNPHAVPSRMTIAQLLEGVMGKACCKMGTLGDATPFNDVSIEHLGSVLESLGAEKYGDEVVYNPRTGEQILCDIFVTPTYYQRLKHMVADKVNSRSNCGPIVGLTRQPTSGKGGAGNGHGGNGNPSRCGEMESSCLLAHGVCSLQKECFVDKSDNYRVIICKMCNMMAVSNPEKGMYACKRCNNTTSFAQCRVPYAFKLLSQEIQTANIGVKFIT